MKPINLKPVFVYLTKGRQMEHDIEFYKTRKGWEDFISGTTAELKTLTEAKDKTMTALTEAIKAEEGRATARTITAQDIVDAVERVTDELCIYKKAMEGISADIDLHAQIFPAAYKYIPESTQFSVLFKGGYWRVTRIVRDRCGSGNRYRITLTDGAKDAIIKRFSAIA